MSIHHPIKILIVSAGLIWASGSIAEIEVEIRSQPDNDTGSSASTSPVKNPSVDQADAAAFRLLVLGDSLSSAYGLELDQGWVAIIRNNLEAESIPYTVFNASIAGETSRGGLYRLPRLLDEKQPHLVVLALGANDALRGLSLKQLSKNLESIVEKCQLSGARVLIAAIPVTANYGSYVLDKMYSLYRGVAEKYQLPFLDFFSEEFMRDQAYFQEDRLHPNAKAQPIIASRFWQPIKEFTQTHRHLWTTH